MDNLVILILFMLASLVSFINKQRELRRQQSEEQYDPNDETEYEPRPFPRTLLEREILSEPPASQAETMPGSIDHPTPVIKDRIAVEARRSEYAEDVHTELRPTLDFLASHDTFRDQARQAIKQSSLPSLGNLNLVSQNYDTSTSLHKKKKLKINLTSKSNSLLRQGIVIREILERPRCYDI